MLLEIGEIFSYLLVISSGKEPTNAEEDLPSANVKCVRTVVSLYKRDSHHTGG